MFLLIILSRITLSEFLVVELCVCWTTVRVLYWRYLQFPSEYPGGPSPLKPINCLQTTFTGLLINDGNISSDENVRHYCLSIRIGGFGLSNPSCLKDVLPRTIDFCVKQFNSYEDYAVLYMVLGIMATDVVAAQPLALKSIEFNRYSKSARFLKNTLTTTTHTSGNDTNFEVRAVARIGLR